MHRKLTVSIVAFGLIAAATQAQAQVRTQEDVALELIGGAIGGGLLGVAGVLTRFAIEDAMQRRSEEASVQAVSRLRRPIPSPTKAVRASTTTSRAAASIPPPAS